jgi:hypothetical protein
MTTQNYALLRTLPILDGIILPPSTKPRPAFTFQELLAFAPKPNAKIQADHNGFDLYTDPVTHVVYHLIKRKNMFWYELRQVTLYPGSIHERSAHFRPTTNITYKHFLKFNHYKKGAWTQHV